MGPTERLWLAPSAWHPPSLPPSFPPSFLPSLPPSRPPIHPLFHPSLPLFSSSLLFLSVSYPPSFTGGTDSPRLRLVQHRAAHRNGRLANERTQTSPGRAEPVFDAGRLRPSASRAPRAAPLRRAGHAAHGPAPIARLFRTVQRRPTPAPATPRRLGPASAALHAHAAARRTTDGRHTALHRRHVCRRRRPAHRPTYVPGVPAQTAGTPPYGLVPHGTMRGGTMRGYGGGAHQATSTASETALRASGHE